MSTPTKQEIEAAAERLGRFAAGDPMSGCSSESPTDDRRILADAYLATRSKQHANAELAREIWEYLDPYPLCISADVVGVLKRSAEALEGE